MIIDISMKIDERMPVYGNLKEARPIITTVNTHETSPFHESRIELGLHTGTHIDFPLHFIEGGKTSDQINLERLITSCRVIDFSYLDEKITDTDLLKHDINENEFILLKTKNSMDESFNPDFVYLDEKGARYLAKRKINGIGIDALSIENRQPGFQTHKILLNEDILILEGLRLAEVTEGEYSLICLPLSISGVEGVPARAVLLK